MHEWSILGLDDKDACVTLNSIEYVMPKNEAALVHSIMCLVDTMEEVGQKIEDMNLTISRN